MPQCIVGGGVQRFEASKRVRADLKPGVVGVTDLESVGSRKERRKVERHKVPQEKPQGCERTGVLLSPLLNLK